LAGGFGVGLLSRLLNPPAKEETPVEKIGSGTKALALAAVPLATTIGRRLAAQAAKGLSARAFVHAGKWLQKRFSMLLALAALAPLTALAAEKPARTPEQMEEAVRLQVFLDRANFGPGKIDGRDGEFTRKALALYRKAHNAPQSTEGDSPKKASSKDKNSATGSASDTEGLDLASVGDPFISYTLTEHDLKAVGELPDDKAAQAKLEQLPYRTPAEGIAEKFHSDVDFLKELNPNVNLDSLKAGDQVKVPNVEPFELAAVESLKPGTQVPPPANATEPEDEAEGAEERSGKKSLDTNNLKSASVKLHLSTKENMLQVRNGEQLLAAFPISSGSGETASPVGEWKIKGVAAMPTFRYDEKMLKEGERSSDFHMLPSGPNSPVGVVWIALNKKGIGIHGTDSPETIGRAASHGCVRLANWDVVKLAQMVKGGVSVTIE
jgi:lipoprotein-anchoring transpeptidase ErfK/SrfK